MSIPDFAIKDAAVILAEALAIYRTETGNTLGAADPRRLHLQAMLLLLAQQRAVIDFAGKQNFLETVDPEYLNALADLWLDSPLPALASTCEMQIKGVNASNTGLLIGKRVTDGSYQWRLTEFGGEIDGAQDVYYYAECTVTGAHTNDASEYTITELVDSVPLISSVTNRTATTGGRDLETPAAFRDRLLAGPEGFTTAGPRSAYEWIAKNASPDVLDAKAYGARDAADMAGATPGPSEIFVYVTKRGANYDLAPPPALLTTVAAALNDETVRPLSDRLTVDGPATVAFQVVVSYWINRSDALRSAEIQAAVTAAVETYIDWQTSRIGIDIIPDALIAAMRAAGAKRVAVTSPVFADVAIDAVAKLNSGQAFVTYMGLEDD